MRERILIAGTGGQGIVLIGKLLATAAADTHEHVTFFPAYGAEVRGGTSNCQVVISTDPIASPVAEAFECAMLMNEAAVDHFASLVVPGGTLVIDGSHGPIPEGQNVHLVNATEQAKALGSTRSANLCMLGAFLALKP